jgi:hypothetical protein
VDGVCLYEAMRCNSSICMNGTSCSDATDCFEVTSQSCNSGEACNCNNNVYCFCGYCPNTITTAYLSNCVWAPL